MRRCCAASPSKGQRQSWKLGAIERGDICWCWPVRYELMADARGSEGIAAVERTVESIREIPVDRGVQGAGVGILHFDQHLERLGDHLGVGSHWISDSENE